LSPSKLAATLAAAAVLLIAAAATGYLFLPGGAPPGEERAPPEIAPPSAGASVQPEASNEPAAEPSLPVDALDDPVVRAGWLRGYKGGNCFFAASMSASPGRIAIEGYGRSEEPFETMLSAFERRFGIAPELGLRPITDAQCPAADFLRRFPNTASETPDLSLEQQDLTTAESMRGQVTAAAGAQTYLLLVDHEGLVHNLEARLDRSGGAARFDVPLGFGSAAPPGLQPSPQILIAIAGKARLRTMGFAGTPAASAILPKIVDEVETRKLAVATSARYLRVRQ
jgi:serine/threonine-protein kinase